MASLFMVLTGLVFLLSWIGNIYAWEGVRSLMRVEGLRWFLRSVQGNFVTCPVLTPVSILFFGIGPWIHSGLGHAWYAWCCRKPSLSRKDKYALLLSMVVGVVYVLVGAILVFGPWNIAKSSLGSWYSSPISIGIWFVVSFGIGLMGVAYGFLSDKYRTDTDMIAGLAYCYRWKASYFITLFLIAQCFNALHYTGLYQFLGLTETTLNCIYVVVSLLPLGEGNRYSVSG